MRCYPDLAGWHLNFKLFLCRDAKPDEYYGIKGVYKVGNTKIVVLCAIFAIVGIIIQVTLIQTSMAFKRQTLDEKSQEASTHHASVRSDALKYGNVGQLERLVEKLKK